MTRVAYFVIFAELFVDYTVYCLPRLFIMFEAFFHDITASFHNVSNVFS